VKVCVSSGGRSTAAWRSQRRDFLWPTGTGLRLSWSREGEKGDRAAARPIPVAHGTAQKLVWGHVFGAAEHAAGGNPQKTVGHHRMQLIIGYLLW
jgi:hypothetical protein